MQSFYAEAGDSDGVSVTRGSTVDSGSTGGTVAGERGDGSSEGLISHMVFPSTAEGLRARLRWHATKFSMKRLLDEGVMLQQEVNGLAPLLPGHGIS